MLIVLETLKLVCDDGFSSTDAESACYTLGYSGGSYVTSSSVLSSRLPLFGKRFFTHFFPLPAFLDIYIYIFCEPSGFIGLMLSFPTKYGARTCHLVGKVEKRNSRGPFSCQSVIAKKSDKISHWICIPESSIAWCKQQEMSLTLK